MWFCIIRGNVSSKRRKITSAECVLKGYKKGIKRKALYIMKLFSRC